MLGHVKDISSRGSYPSTDEVTGFVIRYADVSDWRGSWLVDREAVLTVEDESLGVDVELDGLRLCGSEKEERAARH